MIMCVLLCYPVSIRIYYQQGVLFLVIGAMAQNVKQIMKSEGCGREIIKRCPYVHLSICPRVRSSHFYINLNISFIYKDIITKFAGNVYG